MVNRKASVAKVFTAHKFDGNCIETLELYDDNNLPVKKHNIPTCIARYKSNTTTAKKAAKKELRKSAGGRSAMRRNDHL